MADGQTRRLSIRNGDYASIFYGGNRGDELGRAIACGDVNDDGINDVILGVGKADGLDNSRRGSGEIHVFFGGSSLNGSFDLDFWTSTVLSHRITQNYTENLKIPTSKSQNPNRESPIANPKPQIQNANSQADIIIFGGQSQAKAGQTVASGDINGDGIDDIIFGAPAAGGPIGANLGAGRIYIIYGDSRLPSDIDLEGLVDVVIFGAAAGDSAGCAVHTADLNGDGTDDLIIGSRSADGTDKEKRNVGAVYIIFGHGDLESALSLPDHADVVIFGSAPGEFGRLSFASGRINDDTIDDLIIGAPLADDKASGRRDQGKVYVIFGDANLPAVIDLSPQKATVLATEPHRITRNIRQGSRGAGGQGLAGTASATELHRITQNIRQGGRGAEEQENIRFGTTIIGANTGDNLGSSVAAADFDGDGKDDIIVASASADAIAAGGRKDAGEVYVIYNDNPLLAQDVIELLGNEANLDVRLLGSDAGGQLGISVDAGDLNSDDISDIIIGANNASDPFNPRSRVGEVIVIFGTSEPRLSGRFDLANGLPSLPTPTSLILGDETDDTLGATVFAGDVNGDGVDDLIAGAPLADPPFTDFSTRKPRSKRDAAGEAYIFFNVTNHDVITSVPDDTLSAGAVATLPIKISSYSHSLSRGAGGQGSGGAEEHGGRGAGEQGGAQTQQSAIISGRIVLRFDEDFLMPAGLIVGAAIPSNVEFEDGISDELVIDTGTGAGDISVDLATDGNVTFESITDLRDHVNAAVDDALAGANEDPDTVLVTIIDGTLAFVRKVNLADNTITLREGNGALSKLGFSSESTSTLFDTTPITQSANVVVDTRTPGQESVLFATDTPLGDISHRITQKDTENTAGGQGGKRATGQGSRGAGGSISHRITQKDTEVWARGSGEVGKWESERGRGAGEQGSRGEYQPQNYTEEHRKRQKDSDAGGQGGRRAGEQRGSSPIFREIPGDSVANNGSTGSDELIRVHFLVDESPPSMPGMTRLELNKVEYNEGAVTSIRNSGDLLVTDPDLGDPNGDEVIDATDAADILMFLATGSPPINQDACDVSGDGTCTPFDAALILQFIVGKITSFPAQRVDFLATELHRSPQKEGRGAENEWKVSRFSHFPTFSLSHFPVLLSCSLAVPTAEGEAASTITLAIEISGASDLSSGRVVLHYDSRILRARDITVGDLTAGFLLVSNIRLGAATFAFASDTPVSGDGVLAKVTFEVNGRARIGDSSPLSLSDVSLNGGEIQVTASDGSFTVVDLPILLSAAQPSQIAQGFRGQLVIVGEPDSGAFQPNARVKIKGIKIRAVRFIDSSHLAATLQVSKRSPLGNRDVIVVNPDGEVGTAADLLEIIGVDGQRAPRIDAIVPDQIARGADGQVIFLTGSGLIERTRVRFKGGGIKVKSVTLRGQTELEVEVKVSGGARLGFRDMKVSNPRKGGKHILRNALEITE